MATRGPLRGLAGMFGRFFRRSREEWVEPGNAITRAVLSGDDIRLPEIPYRPAPAWMETPALSAATLAVAADAGERERATMSAERHPEAAETAPPAEAPASGEPVPVPGRWRAA